MFPLIANGKSSIKAKSATAWNKLQRSIYTDLFDSKCLFLKFQYSTSCSMSISKSFINYYILFFIFNLFVMIVINTRGKMRS